MQTIYCLAELPKCHGVFTEDGGMAFEEDDHVHACVGAHENEWHICGECGGTWTEQTVTVGAAS